MWLGRVYRLFCSRHRIPFKPYPRTWWRGRLVGTSRRGIKAWHVDTKRMVSHVPADLASPDVLDLACSPTEPTFAVASASAPGAHGTSALPCVICRVQCGLSWVGRLGACAGRAHLPVWPLQSDQPLPCQCSSTGCSPERAHTRHCFWAQQAHSQLNSVLQS